jgi:hypothetical protein
VTDLLDAPAIDGPGVYDIPETVYHADPVPGGSLSSSGARRLLPPSCPAIFRHEQLNPPPPKKVFDLGSAAHRLVLGSGPDLVLVDKARWDDNDTKAKVAAIREAGGIPLKRAEYDQVHAMADALRRHRVASALFDPAHGRPEQTLIWQDEETGVWCRARLDWQPNARPGRRLIVPDYKTCRSASPRAIAKAVHEHGYHQQTEWYLRGAQALDLADDQAAFVFVFQEKDPPYLVTVVQLDDEALHLARERNRRAMEIYAACVEADHWPGYSDDIELITLPAWAHREENL